MLVPSTEVGLGEVPCGEYFRDPKQTGVLVVTTLTEVVSEPSDSTEASVHFPGSPSQDLWCESGTVFVSDDAPPRTASSSLLSSSSHDWSRISLHDEQTEGTEQLQS